MLSHQIMIELRSVSNIDHCKLCGDLILYVVKAAGGNEFDMCRTLTESIYKEAVQEWSQKKNTRLQSLFFDDFISTFPR